MAEFAVDIAVKRLGDLLMLDAISLHGVRGLVEGLERELGHFLQQEAAICFYGEVANQAELLKLELGHLLEQEASSSHGVRDRVEGLRRKKVERLERELGKLLEKEGIRNWPRVSDQVEVLKRELGDLLKQETIILHGVRVEVERLERELERMQRFLKDVDGKKNNGDDERFKNWVTVMRDIAFEVVACIDTYMDFLARRQQKIGRVGFMKRFVFIFDELISRHKGHVDVEREIKSKLQDLSQRISLNDVANIGETIGTTSQSRSQNVIPILAQLSDDIAMVGFDDEKKKIVQELVDINNADRSVISIVGMGGLGKTTLARSVYNDHKLKRSFDIFAWVIISQEYDSPEILKRILLEVSATPLANTIRGLSLAISKKLKKGKYLVVLDDIWKPDVWNELLKVFPDVKNGSRVIITTRFENAINIADPTTKLHKLRYLNEQESKELFFRKVFLRRDIETCCPTDLIEYARQLVQRCGGLPLALVVLGGFVSAKPQTKDAWQKVVESMKGQFVEGGEMCLDKLALSYYDLPYHLRFCFLYFGCFQKDMDIPAETLVRLWLTEDFLLSRNDKAVEEFGMDCLEELAQRNLIEVTGRKYDDSAKYYRIHDLCHDMCTMVAKHGRFLEICNDGVRCPNISKAPRHLIIFNQIVTGDYSNSDVRGLFYSYHPPLTFKDLEGQLGGFKLLKVLYLNILDMPKFPSEIKSLINLRYLEFHADNLEEVPPWIGHLRVLQTFIIRSKILELISDSLWRIESLMHVEVPTSSAAPPNMGYTVLKKLHTLKGVAAGPWVEYMLRKLTNLSKLNICEISDDHADALSSALPKLGRLASLSIDGDEIPSDNIIKAFSKQSCLKKLSLDGKLNCKQLPDNVVFPQQLVKLVLLYSELEHDPMKTLEKLPCLKYLELGDDSYGGKKMVCSAKGFPKLLSLSIRCCDELEEWEIEEGAMPSLKSLQLCYCPKLMVIPEVLKNVPPDQLVLKHMPSNWYNIRHVSNISF